jgi:hypothetical protein
VEKGFFFSVKSIKFLNLHLKSNLIETEFAASTLFTEIRHLDDCREDIAPLDESYSSVTCDAHRKLASSTLAHHTLGIISLAAGVVTRLRTSAKNSAPELIAYTSYKIENGI